MAAEDTLEIDANNLWGIVLEEALSQYEFQMVHENIDLLVECSNYLTAAYYANQHFFRRDRLGLYRRAWRDALLANVPDLNNFLRASKGKDPM